MIDFDGDGDFDVLDYILLEELEREDDLVADGSGCFNSLLLMVTASWIVCELADWPF